MQWLFCPLGSVVWTHEWSKNDERLLVAVEQGEVDKVTSLLAKKGASAVKLGGDGKSALHVAAIKGQAECLAAILAHGVDTSVTDVSGFSALHLAVKHSHPECVRKLLQSKCAVDTVDSSGRTALHHAAVSGSAPIMQLLCERKCTVDLPDAEGCTALHLSARQAHTEACRCLLDRGADINACDKSGRTPVMLASESNSVGTVELLVQNGADLKMVDFLGHDVLHYVSSREVQVLLCSCLQRVKTDTDTLSPKVLTHDQVARLSEDRSSTPKKRKAPPPPLLSPIQSTDIASPPYLTPTQTPPSGKIDTSQRYNNKGAEVISTDQNAEVEKLALLEKMEDLRLLEDQTHTTTESEDQEQLTSLQAKVAAQSLENQQQKNSSPRADMEQGHLHPNSLDSNNSYLSASTNLDYTAALENEDLSEGSLQEANVIGRPDSAGREAIKGTSEKENLMEEMQRLQAELRELQEENHWLKSGLLPPSTSETADMVVGPLQRGMQESRGSLEQVVHELRAELGHVRAELEADAALIQELEGQLKGQQHQRVSCDHSMEDNSQEMALLLERDQEAREEIAVLREELKGTVPMEMAARDINEMKAELSHVIDGLQQRLLDVSQSYSEANEKLEAQQATEARLRELEHQLEVERASKVHAEDKFKEALEELGLVKRKAEAHVQDSIPMADHTQVVSSMDSTIQGLQDEVSDLCKQLTQKAEQIGVLQEQLAAEKHTSLCDSASRLALETEADRLRRLLQDALRKQDDMTLETAAAMQELKEERQARQSLASRREQEQDELNDKYREALELIESQKKQLAGLLSSEREKEKKIEDLTQDVSKLKEALNSLSQLSYTSSLPKRQNQQLESLQQQIRQLQHQLAECKKQHHEVVSVYRMHLLYAVQGQMDEDVQKALKQILMMCKMPTETK